MNIEIPDELSCLMCEKNKVCKFLPPIRQSIMNILSEVGNWKDRKHTTDVIYGLVGANCTQHSIALEEMCKTCIRNEENHDE